MNRNSLTPQKKDTRIPQKRLLQSILMGFIILALNAYITVSGITDRLIH